MSSEADFANYIQNRLEAVEIFSETQSTCNVELDGALFYAHKIIDGTHYKKVFAFGNARAVIIRYRQNSLKCYNNPRKEGCCDGRLQQLGNDHRRIHNGNRIHREVLAKMVVAQNTRKPQEMAQTQTQTINANPKACRGRFQPIPWQILSQRKTC